MIYIYMGLVAAIVLGILMGKFLAVWILIVMSALLVILILYACYEIKRPNTLPGTSGAFGANVIILIVLIGIVLILITTWVTYFFTSDQTALIEAVQSIEFLRK